MVFVIYCKDTQLLFISCVRLPFPLILRAYLQSWELSKIYVKFCNNISPYFFIIKWYWEHVGYPKANNWTLKLSSTPWFLRKILILTIKYNVCKSLRLIIQRLWFLKYLEAKSHKVYRYLNVYLHRKEQHWTQ